MHPQEDGLASKVGVSDACLAFDEPEHQWIDSVFRGLKTSLPPNALLCSVYNKCFKEAATRIGLSQRDFVVPYQLRHAGAADDLLSKRRPARGRWCWYAKGGRLAEQLSRLPPGLIAHARDCHKHVGRILSACLEIFSGPGIGRNR